MGGILFGTQIQIRTDIRHLDDRLRTVEVAVSNLEQRLTMLAVAVGKLEVAVGQLDQRMETVEGLY